jgi:hypothetical protein
VGISTKKFLSISLWVALAIFIIRCAVFTPESVYDFFGAAGEAVAATTILMALYNSVLWRFNPLEKVPHLMGEYKGTIEYNYFDKLQKKKAAIAIKQTALSVKVRIVTDQITSTSITSNLIKENDEWVLYYTYITNPKSKYSKENPIQHGTCRLVPESKTRLQGIYWTSRQTIGDISLNREDTK